MESDALKKTHGTNSIFDRCKCNKTITYDQFQKLKSVHVTTDKDISNVPWDFPSSVFMILISIKPKPWGDSNCSISVLVQNLERSPKKILADFSSDSWHTSSWRSVSVSVRMHNMGTGYCGIFILFVRPVCLWWEEKKLQRYSAKRERTMRIRLHR